MYDTRALELIDLRKALVSRAAALTKAVTEEIKRPTEIERGEKEEGELSFGLSAKRGRREGRRTSDLGVGSKVDDLVTNVESEDVVVLREGGDGRGV